jgi:hypothetical protein
LPGRFVEDHGVRIYGGFYHFNDDHDGDITGASARIQANVVSGLDVGVQVTNDGFYDTRAFVNVSWTFGPLHRSQLSQRTVRGRLGEHVTRHYTVVAPVRSNVEQNIVATDPDTGLPYRFAHVDSSAPAGGNGSVATPFQTIAAAQAANRDIVFVHAGSSFNGADATIALNSGERILGDGGGAEHFVRVRELNSILLPQGLGNAPTLNTSTANAVTLASNSEFSGFTITNSAGDGILASGVHDIVVRNVLVQGAGGAGMRFLNTSGNVDVGDVIITNAAGDGLHIDGGNAAFRFAGLLDGNNGHAAAVRNTTGVVDLTEADFAGTGSDGILVQNVAGEVSFSDVSLEGTAGKGIEIDGVTGKVGFAGDTLVTGANGTSVEVKNVAAAGIVEFDDLQIHHRHDAGLVVDNNDGTILVNEGLTVANQAGNTASAIDIQNSSGRTAFGDTNVVSSAGSPGVNLENNTGVTSFRSLNASSANGTALYARNAGALNINPNLEIFAGGDIIAVNGTAVDIENTTLNAYFHSVSSSNAPVGIRLVNVPGVFSVHGNGVDAGGSGGVIQGATTGVFLQNVGTVGVISMNFDSNDTGIVSQGAGRLSLTNSRVTNSTGYGIELLNTQNLTVTTTTFSGNGLDDVHADFTNVTTNNYSFFRNSFDTDGGDTIHIAGLGGSAGATMILAVQTNAIDNSFAGGSALDLDWNGSLTTSITQSTIATRGAAGSGIDIVNASSAAATNVTFNNNTMTGTGVNSTAFHVVTNGSSQITANSNLIQFAATGGTGMQFALAPGANVNISNNLIRDTTDGGTGILFDSLVGPSTVTLNNNGVQFADTGGLTDRGIIFASVTTPTINGITYFLTLAGTQTNAVVGADKIFSVPANTTVGKVLVNGLPVP